MHLIEKQFGITAICRGTEVKLSGEEDGVLKAEKTISAMLMLLENGTPQFIHVIKNWLADANDSPSTRPQRPPSDKRSK